MVVSGTIFAALAVCIAVPAYIGVHDQRLRVLAQRKCPHTIGGIGAHAALYQSENAGAIPPDLDTLQRYVQKERGADTWKQFTCPYAQARGVAPTQHGVVCGSSYIYVVPPGVTHYAQIANPGETVCAYEPLEDHDGLGTPVLYWDGHSTWYDAPEAQRIIDEVTAGHNPPRAEAMK
jgi:hypothetical protein